MTPEQLKAHRELEFLRACARASKRNVRDRRELHRVSAERTRKLKQVRKNGRPR